MTRFRKIEFFIILFLFILTFLNCAGLSGSKGLKPTENFSSSNLSIDSGLTDDPEIEQIISSYRRKIESVMNEVIGHASTNLNKGRPEAPLNNFVGDLMLKRANEICGKPIHAAISNVSGLRREIPEGKITVGMIYELYPFDNELVVLEMKGSQILELARQIGENGGECVSGIRIVYQGKKPITILIQEDELKPDNTYFVATNDYLSTPGRKNLGALGQAPREFLGVLLRDVILDEIRDLSSKKKSMTAKIDGRIVFTAE